jgi:hypothetical protein
MAKAIILLKADSDIPSCFMMSLREILVTHSSLAALLESFWKGF